MSCENWITLKEDNDYEINDQTLQIRRKSNKRIVKEWINNRGYFGINLNSKKFLKHRIIANNFIENHDNYDCVDHVNHNRTDNRISNLRWVSKRMNCNNQSKQTFVDEIPEDNVLVEEYNDWEFDFLYFVPENDTFYVYNGVNFVVKPRYQSKWGCYYVHVRDRNGKARKIYYNKFKKQYGLI